MTRKIRTLLFSLLLATAAYAQTITGSISGRVVDQQNAAVANATVTVTEAAKKITVTRKSTSGGDFLIPSLLPGTYSVMVEAAGFKKLTRNDIALDANDKLGVGDLVLEVG